MGLKGIGGKRACRFPVFLARRAPFFCRWREPPGRGNAHHCKPGGRHILLVVSPSGLAILKPINPVAYATGKDVSASGLFDRNKSKAIKNTFLKILRTQAYRNKICVRLRQRHFVLAHRSLSESAGTLGNWMVLIPVHPPRLIRLGEQ